MVGLLKVEIIPKITWTLEIFYSVRFILISA